MTIILKLKLGRRHNYIVIKRNLYIINNWKSACLTKKKKEEDKFTKCNLISKTACFLYTSYRLQAMHYMKGN